MRGIIGWGLKFRLLVVVAAVGTLVVGVVQLREAPVDLLPEFSPPYVAIQTEALGLEIAGSGEPVVNGETGEVNAGASGPRARLRRESSGPAA
jgi:hypothetical protein